MSHRRERSLSGKGLLAYEMASRRSCGTGGPLRNCRRLPRTRTILTWTWRQYRRRVGRSSRTGIWHETYLVKAGQYEAVYGNMPPYGLDKAGRLLPTPSRRVRGSGSASPAVDPSGADQQGVSLITVKPRFVQKTEQE
jgi:hypothetical protein